MPPKNTNLAPLVCQPFIAPVPSRLQRFLTDPYGDGFRRRILGEERCYAAEGEANCKAIGQILKRIGDKWTIMIVGALSRGPMRFNSGTIPGLSHKTLTATLRGLERDAWSSPRRSRPSARVDYELTPEASRCMNRC